MRMRTTRLLSLLLDADAIIGLHSFNLWNQISKQHRICIPPVIAEQAFFYEDKNGNRYPIDLSAHINQELSCNAEELLTFIEQFDSIFKGELHDGDKELLLLLQKDEELILCTCDGAIIKALALLALSDKGISVEKLLKRSGINKNLPHKYSEKRFRTLLKEGSIMRIQGIGLKRILKKKK